VGVVHRDVKPENILVGRDGSLILCDFGSALDSSPSGDDRDELWGTVGYMPPEQLRPGADPRDASMDIYALGLCLYEAVTGSPAFPRLSGEALVKLKLTRLPPAPRCMDHRVPLGLEAIIRQAIDSEPRLRHSSAAELAEDLERFASGKRGHRRS
jgi:serine/threonine protein kinase